MREGSRRLAGAALMLAATACAKPDGCAGPVLVAPEGGDARGATVAELMAHSAAMGMTPSEAQTLIYLEGLNPQATLKPGDRICLDGKPDR